MKGARTTWNITINFSLLFCLSFTLFGCRNQCNNSKIELKSVLMDMPDGQSYLFSSSEHRLTDRLALFDKKYFLWIQENESDSILTITFGNFKLNSDSIFLLPPDSVKMKNSYFSICPDEDKNTEDFQFRASDSSYEPASTEYIFEKLFDRNPITTSTNYITGYFGGVVNDTAIIIDEKKYKFLKTTKISFK